MNKIEEVKCPQCGGKFIIQDERPKYVRCFCRSCGYKWKEGVKK